MAALDPLTISLLLSQGLRIYADIAERMSAGTITDADIDVMLKTLGDQATAWQAKIDAHRASVKP